MFVPAGGSHHAHQPLMTECFRMQPMKSWETLKCSGGLGWKVQFAADGHGWNLCCCREAASFLLGQLIHEINAVILLKRALERNV